MSIAAVGAFAIGHGEEGAAVLLLVAIAEKLETADVVLMRDTVAKSCRSALDLVPG